MEKLVRDKIPEKIENRWEKPNFRVAWDIEFELELFKKLLEESTEVFEEKDDAEKLKEELSDLFEVIYKILELKNISLDEIDEIRKLKKEKNWWFDKKYILNLDNLWKNK